MRLVRPNLMKSPYLRTESKDATISVPTYSKGGYITATMSGDPTAQYTEEIRKGYLTLAVSRAHKCAAGMPQGEGN